MVIGFPPCFPSLNPIEMLFAKLKAMLRKASQRTVDALWGELGALLDTITPQERENYVTSCSYVGA